MISINLSIDQLADAVRKLDSTEKEQLLQVLQEGDFSLSDEQELILKERDEALESGYMKTCTVEDLKERLN
ncbi:hypothetical protein C8P68_102113 [Mucilaginibacter yixingensis]|uniref:Uncharacterized protein n=1 Tax=Mucilaginibacter yixingensis TaxID=1295612 RepID=A0A2T5JC00_9SPHI|nr:hypothetical protein [Mucilaginibacter yixingensis]PTQ99297.1 hypothetical protein C8P68_102113 [Mucilaginibacter yixingensis]